MNILDFLAPDYGMMTKPNDIHELNGVKVSGNQNAILYLAYAARVCPEITANHAYLHACTCFRGKGRYIRRHGDPLRQSHDNVLAYAWWALKSDTMKQIANDIYDFAKWRFFVYQPASRYSLDPRCILQGPTVFMLQLACDKKPGWITSLWVAGSFLVQDHASSAYLLSTLDTDILTAKQHLLSPLKKRIVFWAHDLMAKRREKQSRWYKEYFEYKEHPMVIAALKEGK